MHTRQTNRQLTLLYAIEFLNKALYDTKINDDGLGVYVKADGYIDMTHDSSKSSIKIYR